MRIYTLTIPGKQSVAFDSSSELLDAIDREMVLGECPRSVLLQVDVFEMPYSKFKQLEDDIEDERKVLHIIHARRIEKDPTVQTCDACGDVVRGRPDGIPRHFVDDIAIWTNPPTGFRRCKEA